MPSMANIGILILVRNGVSHVGSLAQTLKQNVNDVGQLIVVDNASDDETCDLVAEHLPDARVLRTKINLGVAGGFNIGMQFIAQPYVIILTQDVLLSDYCVPNLLRSLSSDEKIGIVGCKLLNEDGITIQHAGGRILYPTAEPIQTGRWEKNVGQYGTLSEVDYVTGAVFAIRRHVFEILGGFDEEFRPAYYEDVDFCFRARHAGYRTVYVPDAVAVHKERSSLGRFSQSHYFSHHKNRLRFVFKHLKSEQIRYDFLSNELEMIKTSTICTNEAQALREAYAQDYQLPAPYQANNQAASAVLVELYRTIQESKLIISDDPFTIRRIERQ